MIQFEWDVPLGYYETPFYRAHHWRLSINLQAFQRDIGSVIKIKMYRTYFLRAMSHGHTVQTLLSSDEEMYIHEHA